MYYILLWFEFFPTSALEQRERIWVEKQQVTQTVCATAETEFKA